MVYALDTAVSAGMIRARGDFVDAEVLVEGAGILEQICSPLSERIETGHPQRKM